MTKKDPKRHRNHLKPSRKATSRMRMFQHPLSGADPEAVKAALVMVADQQIAEFPILIDTILQIFRENYPPHILSVVAYYGLQATVSRDGVEKRLSSNIEQHNVEILQALILMIPRENWGKSFAMPMDIQKVFDTIKELTDSFNHRRFKAIFNAIDVQERATLSLQDDLRLHTQVVRNWGSYSQVVRISIELYTPLDILLTDTLGFSATDLIITAGHLVTLLEKRSKTRFRWLKNVFRERKIPRIVRTYYKYNPSTTSKSDEFIKSIPPWATRDHVLAMLLSDIQLLFEDSMRFTANEVAVISGLPINITTKVLNILSLSPGDIYGKNPEHFFMDNPVWISPIILYDDKYFCPAPQSIFSHITGIMHSLSDKVDILKRLERRRSEYLEDKVGNLLSTALPSATIRNNTKWRVGEFEYETDHIALVDKTVVIVEDKSAALTGPGLRGAPYRMRRHVRELISDPSEQSSRLEAVIWRAKAGNRDSLQALAPFDLDFSIVDRVIRVSVTLDDLSILASEEAELKNAGWIPADLALAPTLNIADFESVIDILEKPSFLLHYFEERQRVQKSGHIFADEMDFLGCYLDTGLNLGDLKMQNLVLALTGMSAPIDHFYNSRDAGVMVPKPRPKLTPFIASLVEAIERRAFLGWTTITSDILRCATYDEQRRLEKLMTELKSKVERGWRDPKHECSLVIRSHALHGTVVVFFVYPPQLAERRKERAEDVASQVLGSRDCDRCVMICRDTSRWHEPYASIVVVRSSTEGA